MIHTRHGRSGRLPFVLDHSFHIRVAVTIAGVAASAIIDSGAGRAVLDRDFAQRHGIGLRQGFNVAGITGNAKGELADVFDVDLGELSLAGLSAGVLDLNPYPVPGEPRVDLIIGRELFDALVVDIDFQVETVEFLEPNAAHNFKGFAVPLQVGPRGTPYIDITIEGRSMSVAFDLGYNAALLLSPQFVADVDLLKGRPTSTVASRGAEGVGIGRVAILSSLGIGPLKLHGVPTEIPATWNRPSPGVIGLEVLKRFRIATDYSHGRLWLEPYADLLDKPIARDRSGIGAVPTAAGLSIIHVAEGSPAEKAGLKRGDTIVKIDGEAVDTRYILSHPRMGVRPAGTVFHLTLADGRDLVVTLADYY
jgi:predicted aspartyl protease